jgi:hypothetical protein
MWSSFNSRSFLPGKHIAGCNSSEGKHDPRIGHHGIRPVPLGSFAKDVEILLRHLHINLNGSFHAPLYLPFPAVEQRY